MISNTSSDMCMDTFYDGKNSKCTVQESNARVSHDNKNLLNNFLSKKVNQDINEIPLKLNAITKNKKIENSENILRIPKCCSKGKTFDVYSKTCVDSGFDDFNLISGQDVTIDFYTGILFCPSVQVDYKIPKENVYFDGKNAMVSFLFQKIFL